MTTIADVSSAMPLLHRPLDIHPVLCSAARETGRLAALVVGYVALLALFGLAALSLWIDLPAAVASSRLVPHFSHTASDAPVKLRGSL